MTTNPSRRSSTEWSHPAPAAAFKLPFAGERVIPVKAVCTLPDLFMQAPSHSKVLHWISHGVRGNRLEAHREGQTLWTSVEAVHRFLQRGQSPHG